MFDKLIWFNPNIEYIFHENVVEYDMSSADVSLCEKYKLLSPGKIEQLKLMPKDQRNRSIGVIRRDDQELSKRMQQGLLETRQQFIQSNKLDESNILSLHSDAVIFYSKKRINTDFGHVQFRLDKSYTGYIRYDKIELFHGNGILDIKPKNILTHHRLGLCPHIIKIFEKIENYDLTLLRDLNIFQTLYLQQKFPEYYYTPFGHGKYFNSNLEFLAHLANVCLKEVRQW